MSNPFSLSDNGCLIIDNVNLGVRISDGDPTHAEAIDVVEAFRRYESYARFCREPLLSPAAFLTHLSEFFRPGSGSERQAILHRASIYEGNNYLPLFARNQDLFDSKNGVSQEATAHAVEASKGSENTLDTAATNATRVSPPTYSEMIQVALSVVTPYAKLRQRRRRRGYGRTPEKLSISTEVLDVLCEALSRVDRDFRNLWRDGISERRKERTANDA